MTVSRRQIKPAVIAVLAFALAQCSEQTGPTGWIPRGTISGVITPSGALSAPSPRPALAAARSTAGSSSLGLVAPRRPASLAFPMLKGVTAGHRAARSRPAFAPHDLLVTFRPAPLGAPPVGSAALATAPGVRAVGRAIRWRLAALLPAGASVAAVSPVLLTARVRLADTAQREIVAAALRRDPAVAAVTVNHLMWLGEGRRAVAGSVGGALGAPRTTPNDPGYPIQSWNYGLIDLPRAWAITTGSPAVLVAVVDNGIRFDHPATAANLTTDGYDFVNAADSLVRCTGDTITNDDDGDGGPDADPTIPDSYSFDPVNNCFAPDTLGAHGLHVAGTIGAVGNDGVGVTGVNWHVKIRPVRALGVGGFGTDYDIAQGILYAAGLPVDTGGGGIVQAATGARIINLSLAGPDDDPTLHGAIISAANAGALIVAAAGNDSSSGPAYPAQYPEVLAVAAVGPDGLPASYSNFGPYVALRAPGGEFNFGDASDGVLSTAWLFEPLGGLPAGPVYAWFEGTSMAAPHVSGVAALLLAQTPSLDAAGLRSRLTSHAVGPATAYGVGLVNAYNSLTQSSGPATRLFARLYNATTGAPVRTIAADAGGAFAFSDVEDGLYLVYGGTDEAGDQQVGLPGRLWGGYGGSMTPATIRVFGAAPQPTSFTIGLPNELEPDSTLATPDLLVIGGWVQGVIVDPSTIDVFRVKLAAAGTYTFETTGWVGVCGWALEEATAIGMFDAAGNFITSVGYLDAPNLNYCSRLSFSTSTPGTYYVAVAGAFAGGRYRLQARQGT